MARSPAHAIASGALAAIVVLAVPLLAAPKKSTKKPGPKPQPTIVPAATPTPSATTPPPAASSAPPAPTEESPPTTATTTATTKPDEDVRVLLAICPSATKVKGLEPRALKHLLEKTCRPIALGESDEGAGTAPDLTPDDLVVVACARGKDPITPDDCGLKATLETPSDDGAPHVLQFVADGELALSLETRRVEKAASPANGTALTIVVEAQAQPPTRAPVAWRRGSEGYAAGRWIWFPLPMLTTDFSSSPQGYRLGITPAAAAVGAKIFPSPASRGYLGLSGFVAWNLLVPNDTQTLSNGTQVRINFKAFGAGALFDASGWFALGLGLGHTFTTDARTDFRVWLYFGPRLLSFLGGG